MLSEKDVMKYAYTDKDEIMVKELCDKHKVLERSIVMYY